MPGGPAHVRVMNGRRIGTALQAALLGGLLVGLGVGIPVHGHAEHEGEGAHFGHPDHAHGVTLIRQEMRLERPSPPAVALQESGHVLPAAIGPIPSLPYVAREEPTWESRAPPPDLPRAPPA